MTSLDDITEADILDAYKAGDKFVIHAPNQKATLRHDETGKTWTVTTNRVNLFNDLSKLGIRSVRGKFTLTYADGTVEPLVLE